MNVAAKVLHHAHLVWNSSCLVSSTSHFVDEPGQDEVVCGANLLLVMSSSSSPTPRANPSTRVPIESHDLPTAAEKNPAPHLRWCEDARTSKGEGETSRSAEPRMRREDDSARVTGEASSSTSRSGFHLNQKCRSEIKFRINREERGTKLSNLGL